MIVFTSLICMITSCIVVKKKHDNYKEVVKQSKLVDDIGEELGVDFSDIEEKKD